MIGIRTRYATMATGTTTIQLARRYPSKTSARPGTVLGTATVRRFVLSSLMTQTASLAGLPKFQESPAPHECYRPALHGVGGSPRAFFPASWRSAITEGGFRSVLTI